MEIRRKKEKGSEKKSEKREVTLQAKRIKQGSGEGKQEKRSRLNEAED